MKYSTIEEINTLKALVTEKRAHLDVVMRELNDAQARLHACKTAQEVSVVEADLRESLKIADEELKFIRQAKKAIAKFYKPANVA